MTRYFRVLNHNAAVWATDPSDVAALQAVAAQYGTTLQEISKEAFDALPSDTMVHDDVAVQLGTYLRTSRDLDGYTGQR